MRARYLALLLAILFPLLLAWPALAKEQQGQKTASERVFLLCRSLSAADTLDVKPYLDVFIGYLAKKLGWSPGSYETRFEGSPEGGRRFMEERRPAYAALSLDLYLDLEQRNNLKPMILARAKDMPAERYRILVKKGRYQALQDLKGKILAGDQAGETKFVSRVILAGKLDAASYFELQPTPRPLRAIRQVARGQIDAVLVNSLQYESLKKLPLLEQLQVVFESDSMPNLGLAYAEGRAKPEDIKRLTQALINMCADPEGKNLCADFGIEGFEPASADVLDKVRNLYSSEKTSEK